MQRASPYNATKEGLYFSSPLLSVIRIGPGAGSVPVRGDSVHGRGGERERLRLGRFFKLAR